MAAAAALLADTKTPARAEDGSFKFRGWGGWKHRNHGRGHSTGARVSSHHTQYEVHAVWSHAHLYTQVGMSHMCMDCTQTCTYAIT